MTPKKPRPKKPGRPAIPGLIRVLVTITQDDDAAAKALGRGDRSKGIRLAIRHAARRSADEVLADLQNGHD